MGQGDKFALNMCIAHRNLVSKLVPLLLGNIVPFSTMIQDPCKAF